MKPGLNPRQFIEYSIWVALMNQEQSLKTPQLKVCHNRRGESTSEQYVLFTQAPSEKYIIISQVRAMPCSHQLLSWTCELFTLGSVRNMCAAHIGSSLSQSAHYQKGFHKKQITSGNVVVYTRTIEFSLHTRIQKTIYCLNFHNAHIKALSLISW